MKSRTWPEELGRRYDRVVSGYTLHAFNLETKIKLLERVSKKYLAVHGRVVIADIAYPDRESRAEAQAQWGRLWSDDDFYWAADETMAACREAQLTCSYRQVSSCAGVFVMEKVKQEY